MSANPLPTLRAALSDTRRVKRFTLATLLLAVVCILPDVAYATNTYSDDGSSELQGIFESIAGWTEGYLGRLITILFIAIGIVSGMVRGSLIGFAIGIGAGIGLYNTPKIVEAMFTAVLN